MPIRPVLTAGNPFSGTKLLGNSMGKGFGVLTGLTPLGLQREKIEDD